MDKKEIERYAGGNGTFGKAPKLVLDELHIQGKEGNFYISKTQEDYRKDGIGSDPVAIRILKIRKVLVDLDRNMRTSEHVSNKDDIVLFERDLTTKKNKIIQRGTAADIRSEYTSLTTQQRVYCLYKDELIILVVKGASFGSPNKPSNSIPFYDYLSSFQNDEHVWEYETIITPIIEQGPKGKYYAISFSRGKELSSEELDLTGKKMKELYEHFEKVEKFYAGQDVSRYSDDNFSADNQDSSKEVPVIQIDDEIRAEDLPF
jgi:hypothetical protein